MDEKSKHKELKNELETLEKKLASIKEETARAEELKKDTYLEVIKKIDNISDKKSKDKLFAAIYLILIFICIFFAIAYEVYSSYDIRKRQKAMITSIEDSHDRINLLNSYISVLDENLQLIPDILKKNFGQVNNMASNQIKQFEHISTKSLESLEKVKEIGEESKRIIDEVSGITETTEKSVNKIESLKSKSNESIEKIETLKDNAKENKEKVTTLIQEEQMDKIITYLKKYKTTFNSYKSKNDLSLAYKMVVIDEVGSIPYNVIIEAFRKYKFRNYNAPDIATLKEWDQNMVDLCSNAINYFNNEVNLKDDIKRRDRYFDNFKAKNDYTNYKRWGYFDETLNYADLLTFYKNTLNSVKSRIAYNKNN